MPTEPEGPRRPNDLIDNAVHAMRIATGEIEEEGMLPESKKRADGNEGGTARAA